MRRSHVLIAVALTLALCVTLPAAGAPSPFSLAKRALGSAKKANKRAKKANKAAKAARRRANTALGQIAGGVPSADFATRAGSADNVIPIPRTRVGPSATGPDVVTARAAATPVPLLQRGQLSLYGKCYIEQDGTESVWAELFIASSVDGSIVYSDGVRREGTNANGFLDPGDLEVDRRILDTQSQTGAQPSLSAAPEDIGITALSPDGSAFMGGGFVAAKHADSLPPSGAYGPGHACLFGGYAFGL